MSGAPLADRLRRAISSGLYEEAQNLLAEYRGVLDSLPPGTPELERALREAAEYIEWARRTTLAARAATAAQLASLTAPRPYGAPAHARHTWEMIG